MRRDMVWSASCTVVFFLYLVGPVVAGTVVQGKREVCHCGVLLVTPGAAPAQTPGPPCTCLLHGNCRVVIHT